MDFDYRLNHFAIKILMAKNSLFQTSWHKCLKDNVRQVCHVLFAPVKL